MLFTSLTTEMARSVLEPIGFFLNEDECVLERRGGRWLLRANTDKLAWFPASIDGLAELRTERRVLKLLQQYCQFSCPRVLAVGEDDDFDVRVAVAGSTDPWTTYSRLQTDPLFAQTLGATLGAIIAEQHLRVPSEYAAWLPSVPCWPPSGDWVREQLPAVVPDTATRSRVDNVMVAYAAVGRVPSVLVHSDLGLHNITIDSTTGAVQGVFDYASAAWSDPHHDFRYLVFDFDNSDVLDAALAVYEPLTGTTIDRARVRLYNAACAATFLALRVGVPAEAKHCGRTLDEDLRWFNYSYERAFT